MFLVLLVTSYTEIFMGFNIKIVTKFELRCSRCTEPLKKCVFFCRLTRDNFWNIYVPYIIVIWKMKSKFDCALKNEIWFNYSGIERHSYNRKVTASITTWVLRQPLGPCYEASGDFHFKLVNAQWQKDSLDVAWLLKIT